MISLDLYPELWIHVYGEVNMQPKAEVVKKPGSLGPSRPGSWTLSTQSLTTLPSGLVVLTVGTTGSADCCISSSMLTSCSIGGVNCQSRQAGDLLEGLWFLGRFLPGSSLSATSHERLTGLLWDWNRRDLLTNTGEASVVRGLTDLLLDCSHCDLLLNRGEVLMVGGARFSLMNSSRSVSGEFSISASTSFTSSSSTGSNVTLSGLSSKGIHFLNKMSTTSPATKTSPP
ncbi:unnamed protein product [Sphagnum troendelagicum]